MKYIALTLLIGAVSVWSYVAGQMNVSVVKGSYGPSDGLTSLQTVNPQQTVQSNTLQGGK